MLGRLADSNVKTLSDGEVMDGARGKESGFNSAGAVFLSLFHFYQPFFFF